MRTKIFDALKELKSLHHNSIYTFPILNWWLLKHDDLYKSLLKNQETICEKCKMFKERNLPSGCLLAPSYCVITREENIFIKHFESLDNFTQIYKCEEKCMSAVDRYYMTTVGDENIKQWLIQNYALWKDYVFEFGVFHLDTEDSLVELMKLYNPNFKNLDFTILVERINFKSIEEFLKIYFIYFYEKKLYPEKLNFSEC